MKSKEMDSEKVTIEKAATQVGISPSTLYRYMRKGLVPFGKIGTQLFVKRTVPTKIKLAMQLPGELDWHEKIEWQTADMFELKTNNSTTPLPENPAMDKVVLISKDEAKASNKSDELFSIAKKLKQLGEIDLAGKAALRATEVA